MILLIDIGNSRVKWSRLASGGLGEQRAADYTDWGPADWRRELFPPRDTTEPPGEPVDRVLIASVAAPPARVALIDACRQAIGTAPEFVESTRAAAGVRNGYAVPGQLGVDRWLAVIGAFHRHRRAACVVDVGTAMTIDAVDDAGVHGGGFIVPGPELMVASLLEGTSDLADRWTWHVPDASAGLADNTRDAIERGCVLALARLVDDTVARLAQVGRAPTLVVTGGAAGLLVPWLEIPADLVPDLVLQGLARVAQDHATPGR